MKVLVSTSKAEKDIAKGDTYIINIGTPKKPTLYVGEVLKVSGSKITFRYNGTETRGKNIVLGKGTAKIVEKTKKKRTHKPLSAKVTENILKRIGSKAPAKEEEVPITTGFGPEELLKHLTKKKAITPRSTSSLSFLVTKDRKSPVVLSVPVRGGSHKAVTVTSDLLKSFTVTKRELIKYLGILEVSEGVAVPKKGKVSKEENADIDANEKEFIREFLGIKGKRLLKSKLKGLSYQVKKNRTHPISLYTPGPDDMDNRFPIDVKALKASGVTKTSIVAFLESIGIPKYETPSEVPAVKEEATDLLGMQKEIQGLLKEKGLGNSKITRDLLVLTRNTKAYPEDLAIALKELNWNLLQEGKLGTDQQDGRLTMFAKGMLKVSFSHGRTTSSKFIWDKTLRFS